MVGFVLKVPGLQCKELSPGHWNFSIPHRDKGLASALREVETQAREIRRLEVLVVELRESVSKWEELHDEGADTISLVAQGGSAP